MTARERDAMPRQWALLAAVGAVFVALRVPIFRDPGLVLGWNSDAALFGLMARAMREGSDFPLFFWGQFYLGTLTSMLTAATPLEIGPFALRVAASLEVAAALLFFHFGLRRTFGVGAALVATFWLAAGPAFLFHFTIAPIGAEQLLLVAAVLFWYVVRVPLSTPRQWFTMGVIVGVSLWLHQGIIFLAVGIGVALLIERAVWVRWLLWCLLGVIVGYVPGMAGYLRDDPVLYRRTLPSWNLPRVLDNAIETVRSDLWLLLSDAPPLGIAGGMFLLVFAVAGLRRLAWTRGKIVVVATIAFSAAFWIGTTYPYPGAVRYIVPMVPMVYAAAAFGITTWWRAGGAMRVAAVVAVIVITAGLYPSRIRQVNDVVEARSERYTNWPGDFDPRPTIAALRDGGYRVCYGEVWVAHKLEFLTAPTVRFVPVHSVHRTLRQSLRLIEQPGQKCHVDNTGRVTALSASEEAAWRETVIVRARKAGLE
jgi:hypothetical protein